MLPFASPKGACALLNWWLMAPPPPPTFLYSEEGRGAVIGTPATWAASVWGSELAAMAACQSPSPNRSFSPAHVKCQFWWEEGVGTPPPSHVEVWLFHESLECSSVFSALGDYLYCVGFMFNLKFLFLLDFFSVAAGQQFNAAPASLAKVPALIYQYVPSLCKGGGVATRGEEMS